MKILGSMLLLWILLLTFEPVSGSGPPFTSWAVVYRGLSVEEAVSVDQTSDGGFVVAGRTASFGAGGFDALVLRLDSSGRVIWQRVFGGALDDSASWVRQTSDGGFIVAADLTREDTMYLDGWILRLNSEGSLLWEVSLGGYFDEFLRSVEETPDGGFVVGGTTWSFGAGSMDAWIIRLDGSGDISWQRTYGGPAFDVAEYVQPLSDGGFIVAGETNSFGGIGPFDGWVLRLDSSGEVLWQKAYGGRFGAQIRMIQQTPDGGFIAAGFTDSFRGALSTDGWVLRLDELGNILWEKVYGGRSADVAILLDQTADGGFVVVGSTDSFGSGGWDAWLLRLDGQGGVLWERTYGGTGNDFGSAVLGTSDRGFVVSVVYGSSRSGGADVLVLKLDGNGLICGHCAIPNPSASEVADSAAEVVLTSATVTEPNPSPTPAGATVSRAFLATLRLCHGHPESNIGSMLD